MFSYANEGFPLNARPQTPDTVMSGIPHALNAVNYGSVTPSEGDFQSQRPLYPYLTSAMLQHAFPHTNILHSVYKSSQSNAKVTDFNFQSVENVHTASHINKGNHSNSNIDSSVQESGNCESFDQKTLSTVPEQNEPLSFAKEEVDKVENLTVHSQCPNWTDVDFLNPFVKDVNCIKREEVRSGYKVISKEQSVEMASQHLNDAIKNVYTCPHCSLLFKNTKRFLVHHKWHSFGASLRGRKRAHRRIVVGEDEPRQTKKRRATAKQAGSIACEYCDVTVDSLRALNGHIATAHKDRSKPCPVCGVAFPDLQMKAHLAEGHRDGGGHYSCVHCDKSFTTVHSLIRHVGCHMEKKHECNQCPKRFGSLVKLGIHLRGHARHQSDHTHRCSYCGKGYHDAYSLQVHERGHRGEKPFRCTVCRSAFVTKSTLLKHVYRSHDSGKPHKCPECGRCFNTEKTLLRHISTHSAEKTPG